MTRRRNPSCPSDLKLDRWLVGELTPAEERAIALHVEACGFCKPRQAELAESRRVFARDAPPFAALGRPEARPSDARELARRPGRSAPSAWLIGASALAAAAAIALAVGKPWPSPPATDVASSGTRTKGGVASLGWVVRRGERVFSGRPEQPLRAGDAVRFTVSAREPVYVAVLGLDAGGLVSVYHPEGDQLSRVEAGHEQVLPTAIELDAAPGEERLYGVFCASAVSLSAVKLAIQRSPEAPALPSGCTHERWIITKEPP
jgi:hypothetical protein